MPLESDIRHNALQLFQAVFALIQPISLTICYVIMT